MKENIKCYSFVLCLALSVPASVRTQSITRTVFVPVQFSVLPPAIPGAAPESTYENTLGDVELNMDGGGGAAGRRWRVAVSKSTANWDANLQLDVRRDASRTDVVGGGTYVTVPNAPSSVVFFQSNNVRRVRNLDLQHRVTINGFSILAGTYTTTVTYTITRY